MGGGAAGPADAVRPPVERAQPLDPREGIGRLDARSPLVLLPVRIETRFGNTGSAEAPRHQLWVRIYPDDCSIDTFEETLSNTEVENAKLYWQRVWKAAGAEADERAAWRALVAAHGSGRAGYILDHYQPLNIAQRPAKGNPGGLTPDFPPDPPDKQWSWSQAPQAKHLPDHFVVLGYSGGVQTLQAVGAPVRTPLYVGPDPSALPEDSIHPDEEELIVPEELRWLVDFDAAVAAGMGIAIDLDEEQARSGFDRLLVFGVRLGAGGNKDRQAPGDMGRPAPDEEGRAALEELLAHHQASLGGLEILAQGTPTHNTTGLGSGYGRGANSDSEASFDNRRRAPLFNLEADPRDKRDGQCVAEALGIDPALLQSVPGADGEDQLRARAMQRALWPATLGYWMDKMLTPVFSDETVAQARSFFTGHVRGRGAVPALRIAGQPYGILPTTAFSRIAWLSEPRLERSQPLGGARSFMVGLLRILREIDGDWKTMAEGAAYVGKPGDAHQMLLDVLGLQPDSDEYHWRNSESIDELYNMINLWGAGPSMWRSFQQSGLQESGQELLARLGWSGAAPEILQHAFFSDAGRIESLIDDRPLSESQPIRAYTDDKRNYITWLIDAARTSLDALREEQGFSGGQSPQLLLYLYLRQALLLGYYDSSYELHRSAGFLSAAELAAMKPEPTFVHVQDGASTSESRYAALYKSEPRITESPTLLVADYIAQHMPTLGEASGLVEQLRALEMLAEAPTAQLERLFAEHVDTCSYRFDAWLLGLVSAQLEAMRAGAPGAYLGAYAWVEDLRPSQTQLRPVPVPGDLEESFAAGKPLMHDPGNGGYLLAPSLTHARTAAVLRSGYLANASPENPQTLAVNLSSDRVRMALALLEGIRNGQSLGALLGYDFERGLHDAHELAEVDKFIYPLRGAFPLVANSLASTATGPDVATGAIEARNVLDGRKLATRLRENGASTYPFIDGLPEASPSGAAALEAQANALLDAYDAVADLALAEGVHQAVQGNFERVAATLDAYSSATFPPEPEVVQTPTAGTGLTQRVALQLTAGATAPAGATPRAQAQPALDAWLAHVLPDLGEIGCVVGWSDPVSGTPGSEEVTLANLRLRPLDVLELLRPEDVQAMSELDDRILRFVLSVKSLRPDTTLEIHYRSAPTGELSMFEVSALVHSLRALVQGARPLRPTDVLPPREAAPEHDEALFADPARVTQPKAQLDAIGTDLHGFLMTLKPLLDDPTKNRATLVAGVDGYLEEAVALLERAASFGLPAAGWGFAYEWRRSALGELLGAVHALVLGWDERLAEFDAQLTAYDALPSATDDATRFAALQAAEALVTLVLDPLPSEPAILRTALEGKRAALASVRQAYATATKGAYMSFHESLASVRALPPVATFNATPLDLTPFEDGALDFVARLASTLTPLHDAVAQRSHDAQVHIEAYEAATHAPTQVAELQAAAKALLGESFTLIPEFTPSTAQGNAWAQALAASQGGELFDHLTKTLKIERPVQEWLCGAARVRAPLRAWETCATLATAFRQPEPSLQAVQLPYEAGEGWLAMQFAKPPSGERLLYTAHYATPFAPGARQCGLLLDEWTEVIPSADCEAGLTFNFNRPDNEAGQAILVVTPASASESWQWEDLVGALNETLDLAKKRALEPAQIEPTAYARLLPATIMAVTLYGISITTSMAVAEGVLQRPEVLRRA